MALKAKVSKTQAALKLISDAVLKSETVDVQMNEAMQLCSDAHLELMSDIECCWGKFEETCLDAWSKIDRDLHAQEKPRLPKKRTTCNCDADDHEFTLNDSE